MEQALAAHGITTVDQLRSTIGAGSRDDAKRWLRERLGGSIHPGAIAKIAASVLAIEPTDVATPPAPEPTPAAVAAALTPAAALARASLHSGGVPSDSRRGSRVSRRNSRGHTRAKPE